MPRRVIRGSCAMPRSECRFENPKRLPPRLLDTPPAPDAEVIPVPDTGYTTRTDLAEQQGATPPTQARRVDMLKKARGANQRLQIGLRDARDRILSLEGRLWRANQEIDRLWVEVHHARVEARRAREDYDEIQQELLHDLRTVLIALAQWRTRAIKATPALREVPNALLVLPVVRDLMLQINEEIAQGLHGLKHDVQ